MRKKSAETDLRKMSLDELHNLLEQYKLYIDISEFGCMVFVYLSILAIFVIYLAMGVSPGICVGSAIFAFAASYVVHGVIFKRCSEKRDLISSELCATETVIRKISSFTVDVASESTALEDASGFYYAIAVEDSEPLIVNAARVHLRHPAFPVEKYMASITTYTHPNDDGSARFQEVIIYLTE